ncbi:hypothetical protein CK203_076894 [Vitis vinifera]|uniref:Reverse transcriptase domain-containing protein n=1 Tax=Vitis vinifera TaxID=29760 RepID=A0A438ESM1_VITVI|nr:hypothetical protein CK203_076894 [Vitis vinifera]
MRNAAKLEVDFSEEEVFHALCELNGTRPLEQMVSLSPFGCLAGILNESGVLCKLDIEKAYNHISWNFLLIVMRKMDSREVGSRGLRQGDPLSPYFFGIGMEAFSSLINRAEREGFLLGCRVRDGVQLSHLMFVDDTLVFCEASQGLMVYLSWLLMWFEAISGLKINLDKSEILPMGRVDNVEELTFELGCKPRGVGGGGVCAALSVLGLPLGAAHNSVAGNGRRVRFWEDRWCGDEALSISFLLCMLWRLPKSSNVGPAKEEGLVSPEQLPLCAAEVSINHLLIHCTKARILWDLYLTFWGAMGSFIVSEGDPSWVAWAVCGQEVGERLRKSMAGFLDAFDPYNSVTPSGIFTDRVEVRGF